MHFKGKKKNDKYLKYRYLGTHFSDYSDLKMSFFNETVNGPF